MNISQKYYISKFSSSHISFVCFLRVWFSSNLKKGPKCTHFARIACKIEKVKYFEKFKLNRNLQMISFKMIYNMPRLRHWFSNERWGGGGGLYDFDQYVRCWKQCRTDELVDVLCPSGAYEKDFWWFLDLNQFASN